MLVEVRIGGTLQPAYGIDVSVCGTAADHYDTTIRREEDAVDICERLVVNNRVEECDGVCCGGDGQVGDLDERCSRHEADLKQGECAESRSSVDEAIEEVRVLPRRCTLHLAVLKDELDAGDALMKETMPEAGRFHRRCGECSSDCCLWKARDEAWDEVVF